MPFWSQLSYCLSIYTRTKGYLVKVKGLLFSKLPRATEMRHLSRQGKSKWMDSKQVRGCTFQPLTERIRLPVPLCWVWRFTHKGVSIGAKNVPDR